MSRRLAWGGLALATLLVARHAGAAPGDLDPTWGEEGGLTTPFGESQATAHAVVVQPDGKLVAAGTAADVTGAKFSYALARYDRSGALDPTFGTEGLVLAPVETFRSEAWGLVLQPDGKLVVAGSSSSGNDEDMRLVRYEPDGRLDDTFGEGGQATTPVGTSFDGALALVRQPDGKLVAAGYSYVDGTAAFALVRHNPDGSLDSTFGSDGKVTTPIPSVYAQAQALVQQPDGKLVAAGYLQPGEGASEFALARYNADGMLDESFGEGGIVTTPVGSAFGGQARALVRQPDGKLVAAGYAYNESDTDFALVRYEADGTLDETFGRGGTVTTPIGDSYDDAWALVLQPDGKLVAAGSTLIDDAYQFALARYDRDGALDPTFGTDGKVTAAFGRVSQSAYALMLQPDDGKLVAAGDYYPGFALARFEGGPYVCGNGNLEPGERCDDGNVVAGDCCSPVCQYEAAGVECRAAAGPCDVPETCTGASDACPEDLFRPPGLVCRGVAGPCDVAESCSGADAACPPDGYASSATVCRDAAGPCDVAERCSGADPACPGDQRQAAGVTCRAAVSACDLDETCDGASVACGPDVQRGDDELCDDGDPATGTSTCQADHCVGVRVAVAVQGLDVTIEIPAGRGSTKAQVNIQGFADCGTLDAPPAECRTPTCRTLRRLLQRGCGDALGGIPQALVQAPAPGRVAVTRVFSRSFGGRKRRSVHGRLRLNGLGRRLLQRSGTLAAEAPATVRDRQGNTLRALFRILLQRR